MLSDYRQFSAGPDPFGRTWSVEFKWQMNGIAMRHSDTIDCKFRVSSGDESAEKLVALPHPVLLELSDRLGRPLTDPWVSRLAALHLRNMIETGEDMEKEIVVPTPEQLSLYASQIQ